MKLYQYGCSVSLGEEATTCYGKLIAEKYGFEFIQLSESSASNPYIALKFCETYTRITNKDIIILVGVILIDRVGITIEQVNGNI